MRGSTATAQRDKKGSVLIGLLWCLALLSVVVIGVLHTSRIDLMVQRNYGDRIQAHYLAVAGIEKAKALLYRDARDRSRSGRNHTGELYDSPEDFRDARFSRGQFRILHRGGEAEGGRIVYGMIDEESRLNVNYASFEQLSNIVGMTVDVAAAIMDWRDEDNQVTPGGAEADYYMSLRPPSSPRNGPLLTVRELLMVRGVTREALLGDETERSESSSETEETSGLGEAETGWARLLTVNSAVDNVTGAGQERVNIQTADEQSLAQVPGITPDIAKAIVAYRNQNRFSSVVDLLDVTAVRQQNQQGGQPNQTVQTVPQIGPGGQPVPQANPNQPVPDPSGPKMISEQLLMDIADELTVQNEQTLPGVINPNTASLEVLLCLPGMTRQVAHSIISSRQANGYFQNVAQMLNVQGMTHEILKQLAPLLTVRSETFRILSEGRIDSSKVSERIQEIVHIGLHSVTTLSYREDDL
jgi:DNA uptake protein ComE-like DNA-binding protein